MYIYIYIYMERERCIQYRHLPVYPPVRVEPSYRPDTLSSDSESAEGEGEPKRRDRNYNVL